MAGCAAFCPGKIAELLEKERIHGLDALHLEAEFCVGCGLI